MGKPGVKKAHKQLASLTLSQKKARIDQVLSNIKKSITELTTQKIKAEQNLAEFEHSNPVISDPSVIKLRSIDSIAQVLNAQFTSAGVQKDSLDKLINSKQSASDNDAAAFQAQIRSLDISSKAASQERTALASALEQSRRVVSDIQKNVLSLFKRTSADIFSAKNSIQLIQTEIQNLNKRKLLLAQNLSSAQNDLKERKLKASQELQALELQISAKEIEITGLSSNRIKSAELTASTWKDFQTKRAENWKMAEQIRILISTQVQELQQFKSKQNAIGSEISTAEQEFKKTQASIISSRVTFQNQIKKKQIEIVELGKSRDIAMQKLLSEKEILSQSAQVLSHEIVNKKNELQDIKNRKTAVELAITSVTTPAAPPTSLSTTASKTKKPSKAG